MRRRIGQTSDDELWLVNGLEFALDPAVWQSAETVLVVGKPEGMNLDAQIAPQLSSLTLEKPVASKN